MLPRRALHLQQHATPWRLRCFATNASNSSKSNKGLNLTQYVSPLLLRLHPDTIQRHSAALAQENEQAMKQLNQFLELAGFGCNNDTYNARKQVLSMATARSDDASAPIRFPLLFHIPIEHEQQQQEDDDTTASVAPGLTPVQYVIEVPGALVRRTLVNSARASSRTQDPSTALQSPFAREWQRTTKRILQDLFQVAAIPLVAELEDGTTRSTQLALWLAEEDSIEYQHGVHVAAHNRQQHKEHERFDQMFHEMLTKEKNIVFATTTGMEDGPTAQHAVLMSLISERVCLPKLETLEQKQIVFNWLANFLLMHFMELRLHSLVWNKITLLVSIEEELEKPQVVWDEELPEEGMGILLPAGMDSNELVDFLYEHVEALETALAHKVKVQAKHARTKFKNQQRTTGENQNQNSHQKRKRKAHFYSSLLDKECRGVFLFAHKLVEVHDVEHDLLLRCHEQRVDEHHAQQTRDDGATDDRAKHDRELPAECLRRDLAVSDARHRHDREPDGFVHVRELVIAAPTVLLGAECDVPFEKVQGRGREDPVDEERRHGRQERESLERVLGREPDRHDVHAVERADEVHVVRRRIEAEPIAEEATEQVDAEQHEHVWVPSRKFHKN